eukprot:jgi/Ulvmu1/5894/UM026_0015.1
MIMASSENSGAVDRMGLPSLHEVDDFTKKVNEVSILINGLSNGSISPAYVDSKVVKAVAEQQSPSTPEEPEMEGHGDFESRKAAVQKKVEELKERIQMKQIARQRYDEHVKSNPPTLASTDYIKWDIWCPQDDEDELVASCTPDSAQLRAMEQDINDRHARMVKDRQRAERCRQAGVEAYSNRQWAQAYIHFEEGCNVERSNAKLHSNAAMASIKMGCYAQAIEHCEKVIRLHNFLLNKPEHPMVVKAWQRMAAARIGLQHFKEAAEAMEAALMLAPDNFDIIQAAQRAQRAYAEQKVVSTLAASKDAMTELTAIESLSCSLASLNVDVQQHSDARKAARGLSSLPTINANTETASAQAVRVAQICSKLVSLLKGGDNWRVYFRSCGGLKSAARQLEQCINLLHGQSVHGTYKSGAHTSCESLIIGLAELLNEACQVDTNGHVLSGCVLGEPPGQKQRLSATLLCEGFLSRCCIALVLFEPLALLLHTLSTDELSRQRLAEALISIEEASRERRAIDNIFTHLQSLVPVHQSITISMLSNCMTVPTFAASVSEWLGEGRHAKTMQMLLQQQRCPAMCELAANLLANSATYPKMRYTLACQSVLQDLVSHCSRLSACGNNSAIRALKACLTCLYNIGLQRESNAVAQCLNAETWIGVAHKLIRHEDAVVAQLAACVESRHIAAANADSCLISDRLASELVSLASEAGIATAILPKSDRFREKLRLWPDQVALKAIDAVLRILAGLGASGHLHVLKTPSAVALVSWACCTTAVMDGCAGNAALCIGYIAGDKSLISALKHQGVVVGLVNMVHKRHGTLASRNAAIAVAKLAKDPSCLHQLRECHGFEKIYSLVKI